MYEVQNRKSYKCRWCIIEKKYDEVSIQKEDNTYYLTSKNNKMFKNEC